MAEIVKGPTGMGFNIGLIPPKVRCDPRLPCQSSFVLPDLPLYIILVLYHCTPLDLTVAPIPPLYPLPTLQDSVHIKQVKDGGPAFRAGLQVGDRFLSLNGADISAASQVTSFMLSPSRTSCKHAIVLTRHHESLQACHRPHPSS